MYTTVQVNLYYVTDTVLRKSDLMSRQTVTTLRIQSTMYFPAKLWHPTKHDPLAGCKISTRLLVGWLVEAFSSLNPI